MSTSYEYEGAVFLEVALGVVMQRQTPGVTNSRTTAKKTTILQHTGNKKNSSRPHLWRILRYKQIIDKVSLKKLHKALSKTFFLDTVNFFYSPSDENANSPC